jgi:hypothetical protein
LKLEFTSAVIVAVLAFALTVTLGEQIETWVTSIGVLILVVPILVIFVFGALAMLSADPETARAIGDWTIERLMQHALDSLPAAILSDLGGALVGAVGGFLLRTAAANS